MRFRCGFQRLDVLAASSQFLIFMGQRRVDPFSRGHARINTPTLLALQQFRIQHTGINHNACRISAALLAEGIKRPSFAIAIIIRLTDLCTLWLRTLSGDRDFPTPGILRVNQAAANRSRLTRPASW